MGRIRWFALETKLSIRELAERMKRRSYSADAGDGFIVEQVRPSSLVACFVQRVHHIDEILDPFGRPETFERVEYRRQYFSILDQGTLLEFADLARNARTCIARLSDLADYDLTIVPLSLDPVRWATVINNELRIQGVFDRISISNVQISPDALASVQIDSSTDAVSAFKTFIKVKDVSLNKVRVRLPGKGGTFVVSSNGGIETSMKDRAIVVDAARRTLPSVTLEGHRQGRLSNHSGEPSS